MSLHPRRYDELEARSAPHLRRLNADRILSVAMARAEPFTRGELMRATSLSAPTVGSLSTWLTRQGLLRDLGTGPSRGGRRPTVMEFNARYGFVLGIALGATRTRLALADLRGECLAQRVMPTPSLGPSALLPRLASWATSLLEDARVAPGELLAVAAGAPGAVDRERGIVMALAPNLKGWSQVPMAEQLSQSLGGVPVVIENDVNLAVLAEHWRGAAQDHDTCVFVAVGTGIGAGILIDGALHRGHHSLAGEIALMCMGPQFVERDFGARGCLETLASLKALAARWPAARAGKREGWITALLAAAQRGDRSARQAIHDTATLLGIAVTNLSVVIDPSLIVLGGPLQAQGGGLLEEIRGVMKRIIPSPPAIVASSLGKEATLWGSLLVAITEARRRLRQELGAARPGFAARRSP